MRYPEFIKPGGRIGFIAPSFGCGSIEPYFTRFKYAVKYFEEYPLTDVGSIIETA